MFKKRTPPADPGLDLIDNYQRAIVQARMEHLSTGDHTADVIAQERAVVEALAARIGEALRADHISRRQVGEALRAEYARSQRS